MAEQKNESLKRFGTLSGVFIPNVLTIFGVILFYREGWVVANTGLLGAGLIILIANVVTLITALSMSAIVTNIKIEGGGAYYLISRSLGPEFGGAVGIALFFAQAFSISFYIIGFTLSLSLFFPHVPMWILNTGTLVVLTLLSIFSAEIAIKAQYFIFAAVMASILSFMLGNLSFSNSTPELFGPFIDGGLWKTFAIFFPAVTGIFSGLSLSGDLKQPDKNIPRGTIAAILFTLVFYLAIAVFFAFNHDMSGILKSDLSSGTNVLDSIMQSSSKWGFLVIAGIWAATLSSAIGVLLGAPRTLQALAKDNVVPEALGKGSGPANEPRIAMILSVVLAEVLLMLGNIDFIANLLTMFFLATYGIVNFIAAIEVIIGNPAYRPKVRVPGWVSFIGGAGSFAIMFLIDFKITLVALVLILAIYFVLARRRFNTNWGDVRKGFWATVIEIALANYEKYEEHPRNWRPHIAIFENHKHSRNILLDLSSLISGKIGIISHYIFHDDKVKDFKETFYEELREVRECVKEKNLPFVYPEVILSGKDKDAHLITLQSDGIGTFKANTIISDFDMEDHSLDHHFENLQSYEILKKNVILVKQGEEGRVFEDRIDVWLSGFTKNLSLMLLIPFLITQNSEWGETKLCIRMIVRSDQIKAQMEEHLKEIIKDGRIPAEVLVESLGVECLEEEFCDVERTHWWDRIVQPKNPFSRLIGFMGHLEQSRFQEDDSKRIKEIIKETSKTARMVVLGVNIPEKGKESGYASSIRNMIEEMPLTLLVKGNHNINLFS